MVGNKAPSRPKASKPLGVAALEDKVVQRAVVTILDEIYETDFLGFSYGFRPGRSQHQALDALTVGITRKRMNWVLDLNIRGFFAARSWPAIARRRIKLSQSRSKEAGFAEKSLMSKVRKCGGSAAFPSPLLR